MICMKVLILGATGMLGKALMQEAFLRNLEAIGIARKNTEISIDITDDHSLTNFIFESRPDVVINAAAIVSHEDCENDPGNAYNVNARAVSVLADICASIKAYFIQISTDHYYTGDKDLAHDENYPEKLLNEYARSKYAGECFALLNADTLVVRTNIVGFRDRKGQPTFLEWGINSILEDKSIVLFDDYYTSSITVKQFSVSLFDLIEKRPRGILNIACREVASKKQFIESIAKEMGVTLSKTKSGSVLDFKGTRRAESLGLDVRKAESVLSYKLPDFQEVVSSLVTEYKPRGEKI